MFRFSQFEYMASEMATSENFESDDDDDDGGGWLSQSTFALGNPPLSSRHIQGSERRPLGTGGFDVSALVSLRGLLMVFLRRTYSPRGIPPRACRRIPLVRLMMCVPF